MLLAALAAAVVVGADTPKPLRSLVYRVSYAVQTRLVMRGSGLGNGADPGPASGSGNETRQFGTSNNGTLRVDVVAATAEGGLAVDCALDGDKLSQPTVRVGIFPDGRLAYDPGKNLAPEARLLLPLLARDLFKDRTMTNGATWSVPWPAPARGTTTYTVQGGEGERVRIRISREGTLPGGVSEAGVGTTTYETRLLDPLAYDYEGTVRNEATFQQSESDRITLKASLVSDSFANR